jgi:acyl-CoA thioester hydrolase
MFSSETTIRVRYAETDRMDFVYYGNYAVYFEVARVEALRGMGVTYKEMESQGVLLPVLDYEVRFIRPAVYDDLLTIKTTIPELPGARIKFRYETYNQGGVLLNKASTTLVFVDKESRKPCKAPGHILQAIQPYYS